jgi:hypothetical protein
MPDDFYEEIRLKLTAAEIAIDVLALFHVVGAVRLLGAMIDMPNAFFRGPRQPPSGLTRVDVG